MTEPALKQPVPMQPAVLIRLRPLGPWRFGTGEGGDHRLDTLFRSDRLYSAVTLAMDDLGLLEEWLDATARAGTPVATFSSLFPFQGETLFAPPPATSWPPPTAQLTSPSPVFVSKMRWEAVRFIPLPLVEALITGQQVLADQWAIDAESGCLLRRDRPSQSPFRFSSRPRVAVDRLTAVSYQADPAACVEFENGSGLWLTVRFADGGAAEVWSDRLRAAFRLLADTGFGGRRTAGWGQTAEPEWHNGTWPTLLFPKLGRKTGANEGQSSLYWLLSLYSPANSDQIDWKAGDYRLTVRGGRVQSRAGSGAIKKTVRMITEGSVLSLQNAPVGVAVDVAPDGFPHPVFRSGPALALRLPVLREAAPQPAETTPAEGILETNRDAESAIQPVAMQSDVADEDQPVSAPQPPTQEDTTGLAEPMTFSEPDLEMTVPAEPEQPAEAVPTGEDKDNPQAPSPDEAWPAPAPESTLASESTAGEVHSETETEPAAEATGPAESELPADASGTTAEGERSDHEV